MTFKQAIESVMPLIQAGESGTLVIVSRQNNEWVVTYPYPAEAIPDFYSAIVEKDPLAVSFFGADFSKREFPFVRDTVLCNRLREEYLYIRESGEDTDNLNALVSFFEANVGSFSDSVTDYLTTIDRPLTAIQEMFPTNMATNYEGWFYNEALANDAVKQIESAVNDRMEQMNPTIQSERNDNGMTFNQAIGKIMHEVESAAKEPFIIFRNADGGWHCDTTVNRYGDKYDWVDDTQDPYAITLTGAELAHGSFASVHDRILNERLRAEYENGFFPNTAPDELKALINMVEENIGLFSSEVTDYLTLYDRPLAALYEMASTSLVSDNPDYDYDHEQVSEVVGEVEGEVNSRLNKRKLPEIPLGDEQLPPTPENTQPETTESRNDNGYTVMNSVSINDSDIIISENPDAEYRYMVVENRFTPYYNESGDNNIFTGHTNDYLEAITVFASKVQYNASCVQSRRDLSQSKSGIEYAELKTADCLPYSHNEDFTEKLIIVSASELKPEYRTSEHQLVLCTHGNGARPNAKGTSVFGEELYSGETVCFGRHQIAGIADPAKLPEWAVKKIALLEAKKEPPLKEQAKVTPTKKPTLQEKMKNAKEKVREADAVKPDNGNKTKSKRDERE